MAITKEKKSVVVKGLQDILRTAASVIFVNFRGLTVSQLGELRRRLKAQAGGFKVAKKTLLLRALVGQKAEGEPPALEGEVALAHQKDVAGDDPAAHARNLYEFAKKHKDSLRFLGGIFAGRYVDAPFVEKLALIPPRPVLYGQLVGLLSSPLRRLVVVLDRISARGGPAPGLEQKSS